MNKMFTYKINLQYRGQTYNPLILQHKEKLTSERIKEMLINIKGCLTEDERYNTNHYKNALIECYGFEEIDIVNIQFNL
jgi:hypothetical protein